MKSLSKFGALFLFLLVLLPLSFAQVETSDDSYPALALTLQSFLNPSYTAPFTSGGVQYTCQGAPYKIIPQLNQKSTGWKLTVTTPAVYAEIIDTQNNKYIDSGYGTNGNTISLTGMKTENPQNQEYSLYIYKCSATSSANNGCVATSVESGVVLCNPTTKSTASNINNCEKDYLLTRGYSTDLTKCVSATDVCPNIDDVQASVPSGMSKDSAGNCLTPPSDVKFELSDLKKITGSSSVLTLPYVLYYSGGTNPQDIYQLIITNKGTVDSGLQLEGFYVSRTNSFYNTMKGTLRTNIQLQSTFDDGRTANVKSCGGDATTSSFTVNSIPAGQAKTIYITVPRTNKDSMIAGASNFNVDDQYLLVINAYKACAGVNTVYYDTIGGTLNFAESGTPKIPEVNANETPIDSTARQVTVAGKDIKSKTTSDLQKSTCYSSDMCYSDANCISIAGLKEQGLLTDLDAKQKLEEQKTIGNSLSNQFGTGSVLGAAGGAIGVTYIAGCATTLPACLAIGATAGLILGDKLLDAPSKAIKSGLSKMITGMTQKDEKSWGYCVQNAEQKKGASKILGDLGGAINGAFDNPIAENSTVGLVAAFLLVMLLILSLGGRK